jgi:signal transduction histidine kinase
MLATALALGCVAYRHPWRVTVVAALIAYAVMILVIGRSGLDLLGGPAGALRVVSPAAGIATIVMSGRYLRSVREAADLAEQRARDAERRRRAEAETARLTERARIAGELHDIVAHHVSAIALQAGTGHYAATHAAEPAQRLAEAVRALETIRDGAGQALVDLRGLLEVLRSTSAVAAVGGPAVEPETEITDAVHRTRAAGVTVEAYVDSRTPQAPLVTRLAAARAVQEALTNVLKHAGPGTEATTRVVVDADALRVQVTDCGPAGRRVALPGSGQGLATMRDRVALLGGTVTAGPCAPRGWRVDVSLPLAGNR